MSTPTPSPTLEFCFRLTRAYASLTRRLDHSLGSFHGLSFADFMILSSLSQAPEGRLRRVVLAERLGLTASGITRALIPLEKIGLVKRQSDTRDARVGYAAITPAGTRLLAAALESAELVSEESMRAVPAKQLVALSSVLGDLAGMNATNS